MTIGVDATVTVFFEKGDPISGSWYLCDRCFNKVEVEELINQDGLFVCPECENLDLMEDV